MDTEIYQDCLVGKDDGSEGKDEVLESDISEIQMNLTTSIAPSTTTMSSCTQSNSNNERSNTIVASNLPSKRETSDKPTDVDHNIVNPITPELTNHNESRFECDGMLHHSHNRHEGDDKSPSGELIPRNISGIECNNDHQRMEEYDSTTMTNPFLGHRGGIFSTTTRKPCIPEILFSRQTNQSIRSYSNNLHKPVILHARFDDFRNEVLASRIAWCVFVVRCPVLFTCSQT
jgi:hypothetical protein